MRIERLRLLGTIVAAVMGFLFLLILQEAFQPFEHARYPIEETMIPVDGEVGRAASGVLWAQRPLDMIVLAFLLFVTAACCSVMLRAEAGEES